MWNVDFIEENPCQIRMGRETEPNYGFPYATRLSIGCKCVIGCCPLQASKVRRFDDERRPVW